MSIVSIILIAIGLAMDAFAVSLTIGLDTKDCIKKRVALKAGVFFGIAQGIMPIIGWVLGNSFREYIDKISTWVSFVILVFIGIKMIYEGIKGKDEVCDEYSNKRLIILAIATSIDALVVGVTFIALDVNIILAGAIIAVVTSIICFIGVYLGKVLANVLENKAEIIGGLILISMGINILLA